MTRYVVSPKSTHLPIRIIPPPSGALTAGGQPAAGAAEPGRILTRPYHRQVMPTTLMVAVLPYR